MIALSLGVFTLTTAVEFTYDDQTEWLTFTGSQCGGDRQSPINIDTDDVEDDDSLIKLVFTNYDQQVDGEFENTATNVEFVPDTLDATLTNHLGTYILLQFHLHWGEDDTEGSEHQVDDEQFAAEVHFVHLKQGSSPSDTAGDTFSVVAVLCEARDQAITGTVWEKLSPVPTDFESSITVDDFVYEDLLPTNRDNYQYEGSLTTPLCNETVQWFVLQNTIDIPKDYLDMLRDVERNEEGDLLTFNFRDLQDLNDREVLEFTCDDGDDDRK